MLTLHRILRTFFIAAAVGIGATLIFAALNDEHTRASAPLFGLGVAIILAALPFMPWLIVLPSFLHRPYWGRIDGASTRSRDTAGT